MILKERVSELFKDYDAQIRRAVISAVQDMRDSVNMAALERAIAARDIDAALRILNLTPGFLAPVTAATSSAYTAGGASVVAALPKRGLQFAVRFDGRNPRAEAWAKSSSSRLIVEVLDKTRDTVAEYIRGGIERGINPRKTALEIAGRIDKVSGKRKGGLLGLSSDLSEHVRNARRELSTPEAMRNYLTRTRRDKRYDARVSRAIKAGKPLSPADIELLTSRYSDRLLSYRAERIARTETTAALNAGRDEGVRQLIETGQVRPDQVKKQWKSALDKRTRDSHFDMHNQTVGHSAPFRTPRGNLLMYPGDTALGAPAGEVVNCRCTYLVQIDF